jgi:chemotaxis protein MotA
MFSIIGILIVFGAVVGGYLMEKGKLLVLLQPAELVIIGGAALGTVLIANPPEVLKKIGQGMLGAFRGSPFTHQRYLDSLKMLYDLFNRARREGLTALESDIDEPEKSKIFCTYPAILQDRHVRNFICDTLRTATTGGVEPFDMDQMMELDTEVHHHEAAQPVSALSTVADSLPGLGLGPPEEIGHKVAAALVGTFLGILLCYGLLGPIASNMSRAADDETAYYHVLRVSMTSFIKGLAPMLAVEMGRRATPLHVRPAFQELEALCRKKEPQAVAA